MSPRAKSPQHKDCHNPDCPLAAPPGHYLTKGGYWRIHKYGPDRGKYLHRWVVERLIGDKPGEDKEIHHIDLDKKNCCPYNLAVMDQDIHQAFENSSRRQMVKGTRGFQKRPTPNAEIDKLVVEMIVADWERRGREWSVLAELDRMEPHRRQQGLWDGTDRVG